MSEAQKIRLQHCRCPFHGKRLFQVLHGDASLVSCARKGCAVVAKARDLRGPAKLIPECADYLKATQQLAALGIASA